jgi:inorganic pyrophosphatase
MLRVFIENEAGSDVKHHHDEETLMFLRAERVRAPYPFPYGFVPETRAPDGDCVDCFVITGRALRTGDLIDCEPFALMEQTEAGLVDHNILAVPVGAAPPDLETLRPTLVRFVAEVFAGMPGRETTVGRLLPAEDALAYLHGCARAPGEG